MSPYLGIVIMLVIASGFVGLTIITSMLVGPGRYNRAKYDSYECGIQPTPQPLGGGRFPVKYYITAMLFIIFDIEIVFLYPWAVSFDQMGTVAPLYTWHSNIETDTVGCASRASCPRRTTGDRAPHRPARARSRTPCRGRGARAARS